jgi:hypothetical protein
MSRNSLECVYSVVLRFYPVGCANSIGASTRRDIVANRRASPQAGACVESRVWGAQTRSGHYARDIVANPRASPGGRVVRRVARSFSRH